MENTLLKDIAAVKEKLADMNKNSRLESDKANFLTSNVKIIQELFHVSCTSLKTIQNMKKKRDKACAHPSSKIKIEKIKEKRLVKEQLKISLPMKQIQDEIKIANEDELLMSPLTMPLKRQKPEVNISCYVCKQKFHDTHLFYDKLCDKCANFNYSKRTQICDFAGRVAVVTGCRIKIGYEICLYLLRHNCYVIGTTRFAKECFIRYSKEPDFDSFKSRFQIYSLDLRDLSGLYEFIAYLYKTCTRLDILINNAAQTLRRNVKFYDNIVSGYK